MMGLFSSRPVLPYHTSIQAMDNSLTDQNPHNVPVFSVGELSTAVKSTVESAFYHVRVRGELSGVKRAASGHIYMTLKDEDAVLDGVCWRTTASTLSISPEDGVEVIATGRVTTYAGRSKYQIIIENLEIAGEGALLKVLRDRQQRLAEEGLFRSERKQPLPTLPEIIGIVTSPTGAVIRDILHRLNDRFPRHVLLWPVPVQGEGAAEKIAAAIRGFDTLADGGSLLRPDVLIIARGGGSLEDLWAFNEEAVTRAVAECSIPVISAVGHETDTTLIDFAADVRAPTPTAAAEMAVPVRLELLADVSETAQRMNSALANRLEQARATLEGLSRGLPNLRRMVDEATLRLDDWDERLSLALKTGLRHRESTLAITVSALRAPRPLIARAADDLNSTTRQLAVSMGRLLGARTAALGNRAALLESYSYRRTLERGFALVSDEQGKAIRRGGAIGSGAALSIEFFDATVSATVSAPSSDETDDGARSKTPTKPGPQKSKSDDRQGTLI